MTKEELEKEAEKWLRKFLLCNDCKRKCHCIELNAYCEEQVLKAYLAGAEPREKRIADLERKLEQTEKDLTDYQFNYPKIKDLEKENAELKEEYSDNLSLKDEELMCLETEFNTYKSEAKELLNEFLDFESSCMERGIKISDKIRAKAEQFLKE